MLGLCPVKHAKTIALQRLLGEVVYGNDGIGCEAMMGLSQGQGAQ